MRHSLYNRARIRVSLAPQARTASANGTAVDLSTYDSALLVVLAGVMTDGTHAVKFQESDDGSTGWTDVPAGNVQGGPISLGAVDDNVVRELGYVGYKRYVRPVVTVTGATTGGVYGVLVLVGGEPVVR